MKRLAPFALLALLLAGCANEPASDSGQQADTTTSTGPVWLNNTSAPAPAVTYSLTACDQTHSFYTYPFQAVVPPLPPGFAPVLDASGQFVNVFVSAGDCESGEIVTAEGNISWEGTGDMQVFIPVRTPSSVSDSTVTLDLMPLVGYADEDEVLAQLLNWSFNGPFVKGRFQLLPGVDVGPVRYEEFHTNAADAAYTLRTAVQVAAGPEFNAVYRAWLINDGADPTGHLRITTTAGQNVGAGAAEFQVLTAPTDPFAAGPPHWPGTGHRVNDANVFVQFFPWSDAEG